MNMLQVVSFALAVLVIGGLGVVAVRARHPRPSPVDDADERWLDSARSIVRDGYDIVDHIAAFDRVPTAELQSSSSGLVARIKEFNAEVAAASATAPTSMDGRVCRQVGVQAHLLCGALQRELRIRETLGSGLGPRTERRSTDLNDAVTEFRLAVIDLDQHVELL